MTSRIILAGLFLLGMTFAPAHAEDQVRKFSRISTPPPEDIKNLAIFVDFKNSPKLSALVGSMLQAKGFRVAGTLGEADVHYMMDGAVQIRPGGREGFTEKMAALAEAGTTKEVGGPDYTRQTYHGDAILATAVVMRAISITDVGMWLSQKTGIAGRVNELLTGDPRGICVVDCENWKRIEHVARVAVASARIDGKPFQRGFWFSQTSVYRDKVEAESAMAETLVMALEPFDAVAPAADSHAGEKKSEVPQQDHQQ